MTGRSRRTDLAVVLVSGGMDSCVTAAVAADEGYRLAFLHVNYCQKTESRELVSFHQLAGYYGAEERLVADIRYLADVGGSSLTDDSLPVGNGDDEEMPGRIPMTYVPFRNTHLISIAVSWAEVLRAHRIFIGIVEADASDYPDCRREYLHAMNELIRVGTRPESEVRVEAPVVGMTKAEIVRTGARLRVPFELTWSCYRQEDSPCGECLSCRLRARAFEEAGVKDPLLSS